VNVVVITPPAQLVLPLSLAKSQCRVEHNDDDDLINSLIETATGWLDGPGGWLGRALMPQTLELRLDSFFHGDWIFNGQYIWEQGAWPMGSIWPFRTLIRLPFPPFISLTSVTYEDGAGVDQVVSSAGYSASDAGVEPVFGTNWPVGRIDANAVRIRYQAGYAMNGDVSTVPAPIRHAVLLLVSHWYRNRDAVVGVDNRDSSTELPLGVESLLGPFRVWVP
jgi:uncharacterized phiE125 gp8 family phage protein